MPGQVWVCVCVCMCVCVCVCVGGSEGGGRSSPTSCSKGPESPNNLVTRESGDYFTWTRSRSPEEMNWAK